MGSGQRLLSDGGGGSSFLPSPPQSQSHSRSGEQGTDQQELAGGLIWGPSHMAPPPASQRAKVPQVLHGLWEQRSLARPP